MWGLSSLTRDGITVPCLRKEILSHWNTREVPLQSFILVSYLWLILAVIWIIVKQMFISLAIPPLISTASDMRWYLSNGRKWRGTKELLAECERGGWKAGLKVSIQKTKIMVTSPITSWQADGEIMLTMTDFLFLGSKITVDGDCSHEIKRHLLLGRKGWQT